MGNKEMNDDLFMSMLEKHKSQEIKEARNYYETIQNVKSVLSYEAEGDAPLLERRDGARVAFTTNQDDLQITVAIDEPLHSLLIEMDPLIHCSDVEANYFMYYCILNTPSFGSVDFNSIFRRLTLRTEVSFSDEAVSESSLFKILDALRKEVSQVREHISEVRGKINSCALDDYDDLIYDFERTSDSSEEQEFVRDAMNSIDSTFKSLGCEYYGPTSSLEETISPEWLAYLNRPGNKYLSKFTILPAGVVRVSMYYASPVKGHYFRQAARYCCNWASKLKTGHVTYDRNYGFGFYIDQYLHASLTEATLQSILHRCLQSLEDIAESLHNNANGILKCSFEPEDESIYIEDLETIRHLLSRIAEDAADTGEDGDSEDNDMPVSADDGDSGDTDQLIPIEDLGAAPGDDSGSDADPAIPDWIYDEDEAM